MIKKKKKRSGNKVATTTEREARGERREARGERRPLKIKLNQGNVGEFLFLLPSCLFLNKQEGLIVRRSPTQLRTIKIKNK